MSLEKLLWPGKFLCWRSIFVREWPTWRYLNLVGCRYVSYLSSPTRQVRLPLSLRGLSVNTSQVSTLQEPPRREEQPPPQHDQIGPPDAVTNLRPVRLHIPPNESKLHERYRLLREDTHRYRKYHNIAGNSIYSLMSVSPQVLIQGLLFCPKM